MVAALLASLVFGGARCCCGTAFPNGTASESDDVPAVVLGCVKRHPFGEKIKMQCLRSRRELQTPAVPGAAQLPCSCAALSGARTFIPHFIARCCWFLCFASVVLPIFSLNVGFPPVVVVAVAVGLLIAPPIAVVVAVVGLVIAPRIAVRKPAIGSAARSPFEVVAVCLLLLRLLPLLLLL